MRRKDMSIQVQVVSYSMQGHVYRLAEAVTLAKDGFITAVAL